MTESFLKGPLAGQLFRFALPVATMYLSFPCSFPCSSAYLWGPTLHWPRPSVPAKKQRPAKSCIRRCSFPYSLAWSLPVSAKSSSGRSWPCWLYRRKFWRKQNSICAFSYIRKRRFRRPTSMDPSTLARLSTAATLPGHRPGRMSSSRKGRTIVGIVIRQDKF